MFSNSIVDTDKFLDMPATTRALYFHLGMAADDFGFVGSPKKIMRSTNTSQSDLELLILKSYIIPFESGVCVITDWNVNNVIRKDRVKPTVYASELELLKCEANKPYTLIQDADNQVTTICQPNDNKVTAQDKVSKDKISKGKVYIDATEEKTAQKSSKPKPTKHKYGEYKNVLLSDEDMAKLKSEFPSDWQARIERLSDYIACKGDKYKNHLAVIRNWAKRDKPAPNGQQVKDSYQEAVAEWGIHSTVL